MFPLSIVFPPFSSRSIIQKPVQTCWEGLLNWSSDLLVWIFSLLHFPNISSMGLASGKMPSSTLPNAPPGTRALHLEIDPGSVAIWPMPAMTWVSGIGELHVSARVLVISYFTCYFQDEFYSVLVPYGSLHLSEVQGSNWARCLDREVNSASKTVACPAARPGWTYVNREILRSHC